MYTKEKIKKAREHVRIMKINFPDSKSSLIIEEAMNEIERLQEIERLWNSYLEEFGNFI